MKPSAFLDPRNTTFRLLAPELFGTSFETLNEQITSQQLVVKSATYENFREIFDSFNQEVTNAARQNTPSPFPRNLSATNLVESSRGAEINSGNSV